jgi:Protein of unknown function (DUF664).
MEFKEVIRLLEKYIAEIPARFADFSTDELLSRPAPGKWSRQEILGHLADSALNNLKRFTECQFLPQPYRVAMYFQDALVVANGYQHLPLQQVMDLWKALNRQILYVMKNVPAEKLGYEIITPSGESKTLEWLMIDYIVHMEHHWGQVFRASN